MTEDTKARATASQDPFDIVGISESGSFHESMWLSAIDVYREAFAREPYNENFSADEAGAALTAVLERRGDLVLGKLGSDVISIAGGYQKSEGTYFIEELAVGPAYQGLGYGRRTLDSLLQAASTRSPARFEVRTTAGNARAIALYESKGFMREGVLEAVPQRRIGGRIAVDERVYLSKPAKEAASYGGLRRVVVAHPSGNTTAIVFDQLLTGDRKSLNDSIMRAWKLRHPDQPEIEQCGFLVPAHNQEAVARVEMFGGEFCGNATRSAVWLVTSGKDYSGLIEVSGVEEPLWFRVEGGNVTAEMPLPADEQPVRIIDEGALVQLDGIAQVVVTEPEQRQARGARQMLAELLQGNTYGLATQPAVGVSYYDVATMKAEFCVWVRELETVFDETACGSGTCAVGVAVATHQCESVTLPVIQPSGKVITTAAQFDAKSQRVTNSTITGRVDVLYDGEF